MSHGIQIISVYPVVQMPLKTLNTRMGFEFYSISIKSKQINYNKTKQNKVFACIDININIKSKQDFCLVIWNKENYLDIVIECHTHLSPNLRNKLLMHIWSTYTHISMSALLSSLIRFFVTRFKNQWILQNLITKTCSYNFDPLQPHF